MRKSWVEIAQEKWAGREIPLAVKFTVEQWDKEATDLSYRTIEKVARHEAAHVVALSDGGAKVVRAVISKTGGKVDFDGQPSNEIGMLIAGHAATIQSDLRRMHLPDAILQNHVRAARTTAAVRCDLCRAFRILLNGHDGLDDAALIAFFREHERRAADYVSRRDVVERINKIAAALLEKGELSGDQIATIDDEAMTMTNTRRIELPAQHRSASVEPSSFNESNNTIEVIFTTGATVRRRGFDGQYDEELVVTPEAVRLDRLNAGAPFLNTHNDWNLSDVIGSVVPGTAKIAKGVGTARIKLSTAPGDADTVQKIRDGVIRNISVGYAIHRVEVIEAKSGGVPTWRVVDWEPMEISAVPVPADAGAVIRSRRNQSTKCTVIQLNRCTIVTGPNLNRALRMRMKQRMAEVSSRVGYP